MSRSLPHEEFRRVFELGLLAWGRGGDRNVFLKGERRTNAALRAEVESLLRPH